MNLTQLGLVQCRLIELAIDPANETDWAAAGYGKARGLTLKEIRESFAKCEADPSMRSIAAVLRITDEQLKARGELGHTWMFIAIAAPFVLLLLVCASIIAEPAMHARVIYALGFASALLFGACLLHWRMRNQRKVGLEQEIAIRAAAVQSLNRILDHSPRRSSLDREQIKVVKGLYRHVQSSGQLASLLSPPYEMEGKTSDPGEAAFQ